MKKLIIVQLTLLFAITLFTGCEDTKTNTYVDDNYSTADMYRGGRMYDKWWKETGGAEPTGEHPLYPATSAKSGAETWRCKECHGWDYIGKDGRYSSGSHYTGINGVLNSKGTDANDIFAAIKDEGGNHDFAQFLSDADILDLTKFVREGVVDMSSYIDADGNGIGDASNGETIFNATCGVSNCHGADGNAIDFEEEDGTQGLGFLSNDNPQETLHKIFWGQPDSFMPSMIEEGYSYQDCADILTFIQTLVPNYTTADMYRGGRLYDKWWKVNGSTEPTTDFDPIWSTQSTNTRSGADTWRCKECHGWDYIGKDGRYASGSHYTGFDGISAAMANDVTAIFNAIKDAGGNHDLSAVLSDADIYDLTKFVKEGQVDMYLYMDSTGAAIGDTTNGATLYASTCGNSNCHGADGNAIDFEPEDGNQGLSFLSNDNPQETLHKIFWGQPDSFMPSMLEEGYSHQDCADILAYCQQSL